MEALPKGKVLVTGITGFVGSHLGKLLLEKGYFVRGTVRNVNDKKKMDPLKTLPHQERLEIVEANLLNPECWDKTVAGCNLVAHIASPFPVKVPKNENELIKPAVEGTLNVLRACNKNKEVKAVVFTSSIAAVQSLGKKAKLKMTEEDWADLTTIPPYCKSKTLAEKAAWDFYKTLDKETRFRLTAINPGLIFGPTLIATDFTSGEIIRQLLVGDTFALPRVKYGIVDVRDVAASHLAALESSTSGERFLCVSEDHLWFEDISNILKEEFGKYGYKVTSSKVRYCSAKFASFFSDSAKAIMPWWGLEGVFVNTKIKEQLGIKFISGKESVLKMAYSLIQNGIVPNKINPPKK